MSKSDYINDVRINPMALCSAQEFAKVRGTVRNGVKDAYFIRGIGAGEQFKADLEVMAEVLIKRSRQEQLVYLQAENFDKISINNINDYVEVYDCWKKDQKSELTIQYTQNCKGKGRLLSKALKRSCEIFSLNPAATSSIVKNFCVKSLIRLDSLTKEITQFDEKTSVKIISQNISKRQDYLFFYMLALLGWDVFLVQSSRDISSAEKQLKLSCEFKAGEFGTLDISKLFINKSAEQAKNQAVQIPKDVRQPQSTAMHKVTIPPKDNKTAKNLNSGGRVNDFQRKTNVSSNKTSASAAKEKTFEQLAALASSVVMITVYDSFGKAVSTGSGIMVGKEGYILTNNHVASGGRFYTVRIEDDDNLYKTDEVIKYNGVLDLAVIRIAKLLKPIPVYKGKPLVRGQKVVAIGSPLGLFNSVSDGIIAGFRRINDVDMIQFTAPISHGSSGGAVLNMYGEVIGISTAGIDQGQNLNLAMGYECINNFIRGFC